MKRWVFRITVCIILGAVMTVGVAWGGAFVRVRWGSGSRDQIVLEGSKILEIERFESVQQTRFVLSYWQASVAVRPEAQPSQKIAELLRPFRGIVDEAALMNDSSFDRYILDAAGLPFRALSGGSRFRWTTTNAGGSLSEIPIDVIPSNPPRLLKLDGFGNRVKDARYFPLRPIWPGFLINTLFYAAIWFGLFFAVGRTRRFIRTRRGRCPRCGYDLRGEFKDGCPECGWGRGN